MAQPTNTFDSYDSIGNREDLRDIIYNIAPTQTPFMTNAGRGNATNTLHEWQTDSLAAAVDNNAAIEGDDATLEASTPTVRVGNYTQILDKTVVITNTLEAVDRAGRAKEMTYQLAKRSKELKRDMESSLTANQARVAGNSTLGRRLGGLGSWVAENENVGAGGVAPTGDGTDARTDGTQRAFDEDDLNDVIRQCWTEGGEPNMIMVGPFNKTVLTGFTGNATKYKDVQDKKIINAVDIYVSDFGEMTVVPNRFQRERDAWVLDMDMWEVAFLRDFMVRELSRTGDSEKRLLNVECTLVSKEQKASGIVADLTTS